MKRIGRPKEQISVKDKFMKHVVLDNGCWRWTGTFFEQGYGRMHHHSINECKAHRISWILFKGVIPEGLLVCHDCDNKWCVNPHHLYLGTNQNNMDDLAESGILKGEKNPQAKLTDSKVLEIRNSYANGNITTRELAINFGVSQLLISKIIRGKAWAHIDGPTGRIVRPYKRLTVNEKKTIKQMFKDGYSVYEINRKFPDRHESTIRRNI